MLKVIQIFLNKPVIIIELFLIFFINTNSFSKNLYVNVDGEDTSVFSTITDAYNNSTDDSTIYVGPGVYKCVFSSDLDYFPIKKRINLIGAGPQNSTLVNTIKIETPGVMITGFTISSSNGSGIQLSINKYEGVGNLTVKNCIIINCQGSGVYIQSGTDNLIINNSILYNAHGISGSNAVVKSNIIAFSRKNGINGITKSYLSYNNVFKNFRENESFDNYELSVGEISEDPLFIDMNSGNYALQLSSPCKDAGVIGLPYIDPDGTRNDIGAYGGPGSINFWPYIAGGPVVSEIFLNPRSVPKGSIINIKIKGMVR